MNNNYLVPSSLKYKSAPAVDQELIISLDNSKKQITEFEQSDTISLAQVYDDERQASSIFRPTFKVNYLYYNAYTGTTQYLPFQYSLYYIDPEVSIFTKKWTGLPQYFEYDFFRVKNEYINFPYNSVSSYTYNWLYYITYPFENDYDKTLSYTANKKTYTWKVSDGIPFVINRTTINGNDVISFECIAPHGLSVGEVVELSIYYNNNNLFEVFTLGNDNLGEAENVFTIYNIGYTGTTFANGVRGTFKRVLNSSNLEETRSKYYIRRHKVITNTNDAIVSKAGFEKNPYMEEQKLELACITPNNETRVSKKTSSNAYTITFKRNIDVAQLLDNQKRPISKLFLTIINRGYSGYFNKPLTGIGLKQGWDFNITQDVNSWWADNNVNSNSNIKTESRQDTSGVTVTLYYNQELNTGDTMDGDFCEWNDYDQQERVISNYYHKLKFNQDVFTTESTATGNAPGYFYKPYEPMIIREFSSYVETGDVETIDLNPSYSFFSISDQQFRWRDLYSYGFFDEKNVGVNYPFLNNAHYPYKGYIFKLIPERINYDPSDIISSEKLKAATKLKDKSKKPTFDDCE